MPTIDLGCGGAKRGDIGVDYHPWPNVDAIVKLGFESIPFQNNHFDHAYCTHVIEHIPHILWLPDGTRHLPVKFFLEEVHRILQPGAEFEILTLAYPDPRVWQDPTHVACWTEHTIRHYVGARESEIGNLNDEMAQLHVPFELIRSGLNSDLLLDIRLQKPA